MRFFMLLIVVGLRVPSLDAQDASSYNAYAPAKRQVQTMAMATRSFPPDLAVAHFEFSARGTTLGEAARAASAIGEAIRRALTKVGIPGDSILGRGSLSHSWDHTNPMKIKPNPEFRRYDTTYVFRDMIVVRIRDMKRVDPVLEAALGAGAQKLVLLQFSSSRVHEVGQEALAEATRRARRNAEIMAEAGGGKLGGCWTWLPKKPHRVSPSSSCVPRTPWGDEWQ